MFSLSNEEITCIKQLYEQNNSISEISRVVHFSPRTIREVLNIYSTNNIHIRLPQFNPNRLRNVNYNELCKLSDDENKELKSLREELDI